MRSLNILLVEDDEMISKITSYFLTHNGHKVEIVRNGNDAISSFKGKDYDLILMDIQMPEMDGLEAVREMRKIEMDFYPDGRTTIIAITTNPDKMECLNAGFDGYAQKPFNFEDLKKLFYEYHLI